MFTAQLHGFDIFQSCPIKFLLTRLVGAQLPEQICYASHRRHSRVFAEAERLGGRTRSGQIGSVTAYGDELLLCLAGPNQPFGESLSDVEAYEAVTSTDCDLLCLSLDEIKQSSELSMAMMDAIGARYR